MHSYLFFVLVTLALASFLISPAESFSCYHCIPCKGALTGKNLTECAKAGLDDACAKFTANDEVFRTCASKAMTKVDGKCSQPIPGSTIQGCAYICTDEKCNHAPSLSTSGQLISIVTSLLVCVNIVLP